MSIESVRKKYEEQLLRLPNVTIVGLGRKADRDVIKVYVTHKVPEADLRPGEVIPKILEGYEIDVEESGVLTAQAQDDTDSRYRSSPTRIGDIPSPRTSGTA